MRIKLGKTLSRGARLLRGDWIHAEEYVWATSDQYPMSTVPLHRDAFARGVKVRYIDAIDWKPPQQWVDEITEKDSEAINKARRTNQMEERVLENLQV